MKQIKIIQVGLGPVGQKIVNYLVERGGLEIVAAVDPAEDKAGRNLSELCGLNKDLGIKVFPDMKSAIKKNKPDVALLATVSSLQRIVPQIEEIAKYGINVVSTCEELVFPWDTQPEVARRLDEIAQKYGISILATGVNPGFLMDFLPIALTGVCREVRSIKVSRIQDASIRRIPFQKKIGAGLSLDEFEEKRKTGTLRHVGLRESIQMIARRMGWKLDKTEDILTPIMAKSGFHPHLLPPPSRGRTESFPSSPLAGRIEEGGEIVAGVQQIGKGYVNGKEKITLLFRAAIGEKNPRDTIEIKGTPEITSTIVGGINGDVATCAIIVNAIKSIMNVSPGLKTMTGIPVVSFF